MSYFGAITQNVKADAGNSSTTNLTAGTTFTGVGKSTLGVNGLQWSLKTDNNCTVCVEESDSQASNWDISYKFNYIASKGGRGETVQATKAYWRVTAKNIGTDTTGYFRLSSVLCPIAVLLPSALSEDGRLKSECHITGQTDRHVRVNPTNELATSPVYRMVGTAFDNAGLAGVPDINFWETAITNSGSVVQAGGIITLSTTITNSTAELTSVRRARFVAGSAMLFQGGFASSAAVANNTRRIGAYDDDDGVFAQLAGTTFSVGTRKGTSDTLVDSGDFNGNLGNTFSPVADTYYKLTIEYSPLAVYFYVNGKLLHSVTGGNYADTMTLPARMENNNVGTDAVTTFKSIGIYIARQGELITNPTSYYHALDTEAGKTLKYGAGTLRGIIVSNCVKNAVITLSNSTTDITPTIWTFTSGKLFELPTAIDFHGLPFSDGLRLYVTAQDACVTVIYE